jgi:hypothetical protein
MAVWDDGPVSWIELPRLTLPELAAKRKEELWQVHVGDTPIFTDVIGDFADFAPGVPTARLRELVVQINGVHEFYP